jgi:lipid-binding SYLF domain-containing protein
MLQEVVMHRKLWISIVVCLALMVPVTAVPAEEGDSGKAEKKAKIDAMADEALKELFENSAGAKSLYDQATGYAVFDNLKIAFGISGGGGSGVAVSKGGEKVYMKMGTGGVGLGLGSQKYQVIFLFETDKAFRNFVDKGWKADASAQAAAGTDGANVGSSFHDGIAYFQITEKGLMASADITGTKYWKNKKLND